MTRKNKNRKIQVYFHLKSVFFCSECITQSENGFEATKVVKLSSENK